jgi:hypothetical protein
VLKDTSGSLSASRLFYSWDSQSLGTLSLQDVVVGLDRVMTAGLMESIEWFFKLVSHNW